MKPCVLSLVVGVLVFTPFAVHATDTTKGAGRTPEEVVTTYLEMTREGRFGEIVDLMDPDALTKLQDEFVPLFADLAEEPDGKEFLGKFFDGVKDVDSLRKLTGPQFLRALYRAVFGAFEKLPGGSDALKYTRAQVIGSVPEGSDLVHVVCRVGASVSMGELEFTAKNMVVISLRRSGESWRVVPTGEMEGWVESIRRAIRVIRSQRK